ncbi:MAG: restriction endonuclease subunit S [Methanoregula sp.]|nr:restriction endonuclease subunit S [Methanoregula sp.]
MKERELPDGWELVNFFDYVDFQEGPGIMAVDFTEYGIPLIRLVNLRRKTVTLEGCNFLSPEKVESKWSHFKLKNQDILISSSASTGIVSEVTKESEGSIAYTGIIRLRPKNEALDREFLKIFVGSEIFTRQIDALVTGSTIHHYGPSHLKRVTIPLPPLSVQRQIVAVLERAEAVKRQRHEADAQTGALLQSVFYEMFGDPVRNEREWNVVTVDSISEKIQYGYTESANIEKIGPKFLRITDIQNNGVNWDQVPYCKISNDEKEKYLLKTGDILFARTGATVGKSFRIDQIVQESIFASYLIRVSLSEKVDSNYVFHFFQSQYYWSQIQNTMVGAGQPGVNATKLAKIKIPLPPLPLQQQFARIVESVERIHDQQVASGRQIEGLCEGLMQRAFKGDLIA